VETGLFFPLSRRIARRSDGSCVHQKVLMIDLFCFVFMRVMTVLPL
jgi:hypothetical protein